MTDVYNYLQYTVALIAHSRFGSKFVVKGGTALIAKLIENRATAFYRQTSDIDLHCDAISVWEDFCENILSILNDNEDGYLYTLLKRRCQRGSVQTSDSLSLCIKDGNTTHSFKIDMNVKSNRIITTVFSPVLEINTYDLLTMLSDKIVAVSSNYVFRRIKDLYDIMVISSLSDFQFNEIVEHIQLKHPNAQLQDMLTKEHAPEIQHAYEKYTSIRNKPDYTELVLSAYVFLEPFYVQERNEALYWSKEKAEWLVVSK